MILVHLIKTKHPTSRQIQSLLRLPDYNGVIYKNPSAIRWGKNSRALRQAADLTPAFHSNQRQSFHRRAKQDIKKPWRRSGRRASIFSPLRGTEIALPASGRCLLNDSWHEAVRRCEGGYLNLMGDELREVAAAADKRGGPLALAGNCHLALRHIRLWHIGFS